MLKLGLVGGTGPESTVMYYRGIISGVGEIEGSETLPPLTIDSLSPFEVFRFCTAGDLDGLTEYLLGAIRNLQASGAQTAALTAATTHIVFDRLVEHSPLPLTSMIDTARAEAEQRGVGTIALLGTAFTMRNDFFAQPFEAAAITVVRPNEHEIDLIQARIANELELGIVTDEARELLVSVIDRLRLEHGAEQVILGCTELPLILNDDVSPLPCLDPVPLHIDALVRVITEGSASAGP